MDLNPAPILLVHHGSQELRDLVDEVARAEPDWRYLDRTGQRQRLWAVRDEQDITRIGHLISGSQCLLADGHHRYAAYLRLQEEHPGTPWDAGLAMLVDQADTPLFLGAIHRTLPTVRLDVLVEATRAAGAEVTVRSRPQALGALDSTHLVLTDGETWYAVAPHALDREAAVSWLHDHVLPRLPEPPPRLEHHHTVEDALTCHLTRGTRRAAAEPRLRAGQGPRRVRGAPAREGDLVPAEAEPRRHHATGERRMIRADEATTSTRDRVAPPAW